MANSSPFDFVAYETATNAVRAVAARLCELRQTHDNLRIRFDTGAADENSDIGMLWRLRAELCALEQQQADLCKPIAAILARLGAEA